MSEQTADIVGTTGSEFKITLSPDNPVGTTGKIKKATLQVAGQPDRDVAFSDHEITLQEPNTLAKGDSLLVLSILWGPGDSDSNIEVGAVISGSVQAANPLHYIQVDDIPGYVQLFGK